MKRKHVREHVGITAEILLPLFHASKRDGEIAKALNCKRTNITNWRRRLKIAPLPTVLKTPQLSPEQTAAIEAHLDSELPNVVIARLVGVTARKVWLVRMKVDARRAKCSSLGHDRPWWQPLADWPVGVRFEDAAVPSEPRGHISPAAFTDSMIGNGTAMLCAENRYI